MDSVEKTRRELFEAWFAKLNAYIPDKQVYNTLWYYCDPKVQDAWLIWSAALEAIVIELPALKNSTSYYDGGDVHDSAINQCRYNIESLNLGIKIK